MTRDQETELFDLLMRHPRFGEWVQSQLDDQIKVLLVNPNLDQLHKAQGASTVYRSMLDKLAAAKAALR